MEKKKLYEQKGVAMTCRSFAEYEKMFMLEERDLTKGRILDVAAGASSFTAECLQRGYEAVAVDPLYSLTFEQMSEYGYSELKLATEKLKKNEDLFVWDSYKSLEVHEEIRQNSLHRFLESYRNKQENGRYVTAFLPKLPFHSQEFSLILCNHFLFLYQEQFDETFHEQSIQELIRVTKKGGAICIYPLVGFKDERYPSLNQLMNKLSSQQGLKVTEMNTTFRFLPSASHYLRIDC